MSLTLEQILDECREDLPQVFGSEKTASQKAPVAISSKDVSDMVSLLKEASVPEPVEKPVHIVEESSIYEKVAAAAIINGVLKTIETEGPKVIEFKKVALANGFSPIEIEKLIETRTKEAGIKNMLTSNAAKNIAKGVTAVGTLGAVGKGSYDYGSAKEKENTKAVGQAAFTLGRRLEGARLRNFLQQRARENAQEGA